MDASSLRDLSDACPLEGYALPKLYRKVYYSVSVRAGRGRLGQWRRGLGRSAAGQCSGLPALPPCAASDAGRLPSLSPPCPPPLHPAALQAAIHSRVVRVRSAKNRKNREPPQRPFFRCGRVAATLCSGGSPCAACRPPAPER